MPSIYCRACSKMTNHGGNSQPGPVTCSCKRRWSQLGILLQQVIVLIYWSCGVIDCTLTISSGDCLRRFFAALSVGLVLNNGHGIADVTNENMSNYWILRACCLACDFLPFLFMYHLCPSIEEANQLQKSIANQSKGIEPPDSSDSLDDDAYSKSKAATTPGDN